MKNLINAALNGIVSELNIDSNLNDAISYAINSGGKRIRPTIACMVYKARKKSVSREILRMASAIEMIHTASLIHDDLPGIDNDDFRRKKPTVHKKFDEATAILAGDLLFVKGVALFSENGKLGKIGANIIESLINGEFLDVRYENKKVKIEDWLRMVKGKTAALIRLSFLTGAILADYSNEETDKLGEVGESIGIAFQMTDDLLDVIGSEKEVGKKLRKDREKGKCTALQYCSVNELKEKTEIYFNRGIDIINTIDGDFNDLIEYLIILKERTR